MVLRYLFAVWLMMGSMAMAAMELSRDGRSVYVIVVDDKAIAPDLYAARQLQEHLKLVTGADLPILKESDTAGNDAPRIIVGRTTLTKQLLPELEWNSLGQDGIIIKTAGGHLILAGGEPRGTIYAVNTFLEDVVGVRWWTSSESTIPKRPTFSIDDMDTSYVPTFRYREAYNFDSIGERAAFAARLRVNGHHNAIPSEMGGHYSILEWCHSSFDLVPPAKHFATHPEWFAQINGKRQTGTQLCLTNSKMQEELIRSAVKRVRKNPSAGMISISQNDCFGPCQCDVCTAVVKEEGSESGPWIRLVNAAAAEINKEYPDFLVETLAYQYTRKPPKVTKPSKNVIVRLCSIEGDFSHPLSGESNKSFGDDLLGWKAIAPSLFIWNYVTNFSSYVLPHPNLKPLAEDLRFFAANNVIGVFEQGDSANNLAGDFLPLRTWMLGHLLWDPSKDQVKLQQEFLQGYYGPAAPFFAEYLEIVSAPANDPKFRMGCYNTETKFLSDDAITRATHLFDEASNAAGNDAELQRRVRRERLALDHVKLLRYDFTAAKKAHPNDPEAARSDYVTKVQQWATAARELGVKNFSEGRGLDSYVPVLMSRAARYIPPVLPPAGVEVPQGWFDIQEDQFAIPGDKHRAELVDDPKASNNRAARMPGGNKDWAVQFPVSKQAKLTGKGPWNCYVVVRVDATAKAGAAFSFGLHDRGGREYVARDHIGLDFAGDGEYHVYGITVDELTPTMYFWVSAPANSKGVEAVYVDRIVIQNNSTDGEAK